MDCKLGFSMGDRAGRQGCPNEGALMIQAWKCRASKPYLLGAVLYADCGHYFSLHACCLHLAPKTQRFGCLKCRLCSSALNCSSAWNCGNASLQLPAQAQRRSMQGLAKQMALQSKDKRIQLQGCCDELGRSPGVQLSGPE